LPRLIATGYFGLNSQSCMLSRKQMLCEGGAIPRAQGGSKWQPNFQGRCPITQISAGLEGLASRPSPCGRCPLDSSRTSKRPPWRSNWISSLICGGRAVRWRGITKNIAPGIHSKIVRSSHFQGLVMELLFVEFPAPSREANAPRIHNYFSLERQNHFRASLPFGAFFNVRNVVKHGGTWATK
jgi:hypothetical protein